MLKEKTSFTIFECFVYNSYTERMKQKHHHSIHPTGKWKNSKPIDLQQKRKKPLLILFWHSHNPVSVEALHQLDAMVKSYEKKFPIDVLAIHAPEFSDAFDPWERLVDAMNISLPVFHDPHYHSWERFGVSSSPSYVVIDGNGEEMIRRVGTIEDSGIAQFVYSLLP